MGAAADKLDSSVPPSDADELRHLQFEAASERLEEQRGPMKALDRRARDVGTDRFDKAEQLVPLLFAHSTYKTYPESFIAQAKWTSLSRWLDTVSTCDISAVDVQGVVDLDNWIDRLRDAGITIVASSGTTGKHSFLTLNERDFDRLRASQVAVWQAAPGGHPPDRPFAYLGPVSAPPLLEARRRILPVNADVLTEDRVRLAESVEFARIRAAMADGTAVPSDVETMETRIKGRSARLTANMTDLAHKVFGRRDKPQTVMGMLGMFWRLMETGRAQGIPDGTFHPETLVIILGGLKGLRLPADYQEQLERFFGKVASPRRYGMTELSGEMPMCTAGRYHIPAGIIPLILDETGETLLKPDAKGQVSGRFAAFNVLVEGHWGGVVSGDKVTADFRPVCACGMPGPVIDPEIVRYSELSAAGDDKLTCGGTMEQYIRGSIEPE